MKTEEIYKTRVMSANEISAEICICKSWVNHWENFSGNTAEACASIDCSHVSEVGAHVIEVRDSNEINYNDSCFIVPLCNGHKQSGSSFEVSGALISANVDETCNKTEYDKQKKLRSI